MQKIIFLICFIFLFYKCENKTYESIYENTFLVNNPYDFCSKSDLNNIYYVTKVENKIFLGYVMPEKIMFCNENVFIIEGVFKDFYTDIKCSGSFYSYINEDYLIAFFKTNDGVYCYDTSIKLYKRQYFYEKLFYFFTKDL